jgi:3-deoxy-manno-octulosonate cytidylyltransferase (CMP-KDO synthetase)
VATNCNTALPAESQNNPLTALAQQVLTVIPARYASTRFPGKPLALIAGKPMVLHVVDRVYESQLAHSQVVVATDDERIATVVAQAGHAVCLTSPTHLTGSDRVWEVAQQYPQLPYVLNVQGDEPFIPPSVLNTTLASLQQWQGVADIITLVTPLVSPSVRGEANRLTALQQALGDANQVKAVLSQRGQVLYFSRAGVPFVRDGLATALTEQALPFYRHLGLYLYHRNALATFVNTPPTVLEQLEKLEQLRAMEVGLTLYAAVVLEAPIGVDTPDDWERLRLALG